MQKSSGLISAKEEGHQIAKRISFEQMAKEPFRLFFPQAVLAGLIGVGLWPLYFWHLTNSYPGQAHTRLMAQGFFAGFIFGFLGTALPGLLSAKKFRRWEMSILLGLHAAAVAAYATQKLAFGDWMFLVLVLFLAACLARRVVDRKDNPPPGFILIGLAFGCVVAGSILAIAQNHLEIAPVWINLQRLLSSQGFVLLPILGVGPFLLPRFFGIESTHNFPEAIVASTEWRRKAMLAAATGAVIIASFFIEAYGRYWEAYALRLLTTLTYLWLEFPLHKNPKVKSALVQVLRISFAAVLLGFATIALFPRFRLGLLHLTLIGGFAVITLVVATRVVFGHSGNLAKLDRSNSSFLLALGFMFFAMATRVSGDLWPAIMETHYIYGALLWAAGVLLWSWRVLPKVLQFED